MQLLLPSCLGLLNLSPLLIEIHVPLVAELGDYGILLSSISCSLPVSHLIMYRENLHEKLASLSEQLGQCGDLVLRDEFATHQTPVILDGLNEARLQSTTQGVQAGVREG